jgi:hypothetical protein
VELKEGAMPGIRVDSKNSIRKIDVFASSRSRAYQNHLAKCGTAIEYHLERVGDCRIPVVQRPSEMLQKKQGKPGAASETSVSILLILHLQKLRWSSDVSDGVCV